MAARTINPVKVTAIGLPLVRGHPSEGSNVCRALASTRIASQHELHHPLSSSPTPSTLNLRSFPLPRSVTLNKAFLYTRLERKRPKRRARIRQSSASGKEARSFARQVPRQVALRSGTRWQQREARTKKHQPESGRPRGFPGKREGVRREGVFLSLARENKGFHPPYALRCTHHTHQRLRESFFTEKKTKKNTAALLIQPLSSTLRAASLSPRRGAT